MRGRGGERAEVEVSVKIWETLGWGEVWARTERRGRGDCVDDHCGCGEVRKEEGKRERGAREGRRFKGWCPFHFHLFFSCFEQY
jgi:hypothetical protein